jgi:hypothetical protein
MAGESGAVDLAVVPGERSGFQDADDEVRVLGESGGDDQAGGAPADNQEVERLLDEFFCAEVGAIHGVAAC